jgi:phosphatidylglycerol:prolipoprotein diacylglycerol transferase
MGRPVHGDLPWAVKFPQDMYHWLGQERDKLPRLGDVVGELGVSRENWGQWLGQYSASRDARGHVQGLVERIIYEIQNGNVKIAEMMQPLLEARHPSQIYQALMEGLLVVTICFLVWRRPRKPGVIGTLFLTLYAIMRIIGEQFRMPDAHIGYQIFGLTRGQVLSFVMLAGSIVFLIWTIRRPADKISGWGREAQALKAAEEPGAKKKEPKAQKA